MVKKVVYSVVTGSLILATQVVNADDTQFWTGDRYQGVAALPFDAFAGKAEVRRDAVAPAIAPQSIAGTARVAPAPYDTPGGYFN